MQTLESWGRLPKNSSPVLNWHWRHQAPALPAGETILPFGNGRSYGDSCLNLAGSLLHTRSLNRLIHFDAQAGILTCEAGVLLSEMLAVIVPQGWFLPVTPGTQFVTMAGAIANDVHGKNHHRDGTFGNHVLQFELVRSDGQRLLCSPQENPAYFNATIGGLGLTGTITWATIRLQPIESNQIDNESIKYGNLQEFFHLAAESDGSHPYTVAWVDCAARGRRLGRGLFMRGDHAKGASRPASKLALSCPIEPPFSLINRASLNAFNFCYYHKQRKREQHSRIHYAPFFYPLDAVSDWNRIYGPKGFYQYQCAIPVANAEPAMQEILERIARSGLGSFLAVLKMFGNMPSPGLLSFPCHGATLALDFPNMGERTLKLMAELDKVTLAAGGRVYPAKDARMSAEHFALFYPQWRELEALRDPQHNSTFWQRVTAL
ncbi:FAD-binding oxidoreductase [Pseudaeromonas paramecii]|uniref:FAD-binding oxidoreductase n=1 Tax=Pseudaeromonas paramecii TaxID=2138166 RepID=A0ABP8QKB6_9GAMM